MATLPGDYDFHIKAGAKWTDTITWKIDGEGVDVSSGYTLTLRLKSVAGTTSITCTGDSSGNITWIVPKTTVDALTGFVTYDICATSGDGTANWLLAGTLEVTA